MQYILNNCVFQLIMLRIIALVQSLFVLIQSATIHIDDMNPSTFC